MKVIIQRVKEASVAVDGKIVSAIKEGLLCLVGIGRNDTQDDAKWMSNKLLSLRLWPNADEKPWQESVKTRDCEVLLVSQFTLHAILKGNKPDYSHSMRPNEAKIFFDDFVKSCRSWRRTLLTAAAGRHRHTLHPPLCRPGRPGSPLSLPGKAG